MSKLCSGEGCLASVLTEASSDANGQVFSGESVGTAQGKLQVPDKREVQQEPQRRSVSVNQMVRQSL